MILPRVGAGATWMKCSSTWGKTRRRRTDQSRDIIRLVGFAAQSFDCRPIWPLWFAMLLKQEITHQAARLSEKLCASGRRDALRDPMRSVKSGGFGMRALRAVRARISTPPRSRSVAGNAFRLIASSAGRAGRGDIAEEFQGVSLLQAERYRAQHLALGGRLKSACLLHRTSALSGRAVGGMSPQTPANCQMARRPGRQHSA